MSLNLIRAIANTENDDNIHLGRWLVLLLAANETSSRSVNGITKLAKLDFLLRYPNCLERALQAVNEPIELAEVKEYERSTIESKMIRFKYGPWDSRYRRWLNLLAARELATIEIQKKTIIIELTEYGRVIGEQTASDESYRETFLRSQLIIKVFGHYSSSGIKDFIYQVFPELLTMKWGEDILL